MVCLLLSFLKKECKCEKVSKYKDYKQEKLCKNYLKIFWLNIVIKFADKHSKFNENPLLRFFVYLVISVLFVYHVGAEEYSDETIKAIGQGFFIAPLVNLMISNQEKIIEMFVLVFSIEDSIPEDTTLDPYSQTIRNSLLDCKNMQDSFREQEKYIWKLFSTAATQAIANRENFKRLNNKTLLVSGFWLIIGYNLFIFGMHNWSLGILFFSFLMVINRLLLGLRSIIKYYLIFKVSSLLKEHMKEKITKELDKSFNV